MDVPRVRKPQRARWIALALVVAVVAVVSVALGRLRQGLPVVDVSTVTTATVVQRSYGFARCARKGRWCRSTSAGSRRQRTSGRVETIHFRAGATVAPDTLLVDLSNPETVLQQLQTEREVASAEADLLQLSFRLQADKLTQESALWTLRQESSDVERRAAAYAQGGSALFTQLDIDQMKDRAAGIRQRIAVAEKELAVLEEGLSAQVAAQRVQIERRREMAVFRKTQVEALRVRAGGDGILQDMPLEIGQWVSPGTVLAKIVKPEHLKALLRVPEVQAKDVAPGQSVEVDTRNGVVAGHVYRVATAAAQGTVQVEVLLDGALPAGARPDLDIDGIILIERLDDVLSLERPVGAQQDKPMTLFRLEAGGREALRAFGSSWGGCPPRPRSSKMVCAKEPGHRIGHVPLGSRQTESALR